MMKKVARKDWKFVKPDPDPDFNAKRNKWVVDETIRKTDEMIAKKGKEHDEGIRERVWASTKYAGNVQKGGVVDPVKFFGKDYALYLKGKSIIERLQDPLRVFNKQGKVTRKPS